MSFRLGKQLTGLVIIDVQPKLMGVMRRSQVVTGNVATLIELAKLIKLPIVLTEQHPKWLGVTVPEIRDVLPDYRPIEKLHFDCCAVDDFNDRLEAVGVKNVILTGVETHICVLQTCLSLLAKGYNIHVPQCAVDSRTEENRRAGLEMMRQAGAVITSTETVVFQLLEKAGTPEFKAMLKLIK